MMKRLAILLCGIASCAAAQVKDISGTWVAKFETPMGESEVVYQLKQDAQGSLSGSQRLPFGDSPIESGKVTGDKFTFIVKLESFGNIQEREVKGKIVGDSLQLTPALPGPPPGAGAGPGGPGGPPPRMRMGMLTLKRGTPAPSYRASVDYKSLPHLDLPALKDYAALGAAKTPPMGWNSWNKFHTNIDDKTVREIADAMVTSGMREAGYVYVNIDDGWQDKRDDKGVLQPNPKFPDMKALAEYVHGKRLKLGIYSSPGPQTCGGFTGSYGHEEIDAATWAAWGIDYLKYDWCSASRVWGDADMRAVYQRMSDAIQKAGRPMVYALCQYGRANVREWGPKVGASLWRVTGDIRDSWASMSGIGFAQIQATDNIQPGRWNDPDMLEVGNGRMSNDEYKTHMSLWAMLAAPLIAGNDVRAMSAEVKEILLNREVLAVDQDALGSGPYRVSKEGATEVWARRLSGEDYVVAMFNTGDAPTSVAVNWAALKSNGALHVRDLWRHQDLGQKAEGFTAEAPAHGVVMVRLSR